MFETLSHRHNHNIAAATASAACSTHGHHDTDALAHLPTSRSEFAPMSSVKATEPSLEPPPRPPSSPGKEEEEDDDDEEVLFQPRGKQQKRPSSSPSLPHQGAAPYRLPRRPPITLTAFFSLRLQPGRQSWMTTDHKSRLPLQAS